MDENWVLIGGKVLGIEALLETVCKSQCRKAEKIKKKVTTTKSGCGWKDEVEEQEKNYRNLWREVYMGEGFGVGHW